MSGREDMNWSIKYQLSLWSMGPIAWKPRIPQSGDGKMKQFILFLLKSCGSEDESLKPLPIKHMQSSWSTWMGRNQGWYVPAFDADNFCSSLLVSFCLDNTSCLSLVNVFSWADACRMIDCMWSVVHKRNNTYALRAVVSHFSKTDKMAGFHLPSGFTLSWKLVI